MVNVSIGLVGGQQRMSTWVATLAAGLVLFGCGGGDDDSGGNTPSGGSGNAAGSGGSSGKGGSGGSNGVSSGDSGSGGSIGGSGGKGGAGGTGGGSGGSNGGSSAKGGTGGSNAGTGGSSGGNVEGEPHTLSGSGDFEVTDDGGDTVAVVSWLSGNNAVVGVSGASLPDDAPDAFEDVTGLRIDFADATTSLTLKFVAPEDANADEYVVVVDTAYSRQVHPVSLSSGSEGTFLTYATNRDASIVLVKLHPAAGCTEVSSGGTFSSPSALAELESTYRVTTGVNVSGSSFTTLESLHCLLVADEGLQIRDTNIESTAGLESFAAASELRFVNNQLLTTASLPQFFAGGFSLRESPLLEETNVDLLDGASVSVVENGEAASGTELSFKRLVRALTLDLEHNPELASLKGFKALAGTDGLTLYDNDSLESLAGLESLARAGVLEIRDNDALLDVDALEALETVVISPESVTGGDGASIDENPALESIHLPALTKLGEEGTGSLEVRSNGALVSLTAPKLEQLQQVTLGGNGNASHALKTDFSALETLKTLNISGNAGLRSLSGFGSLSQVTDTLTISDNELLASLDGLQALKGVKALTVQSNASLEVIAELEALKNVSGAITVTANATLTSLSFPALAVVQDGITITANNVLENVEVDGIKTTKQLSVQSNGATDTTLTLSFAKLQTVLGSFTIGQNPGLKDLDGFGALRSVDGTLSLSANIALENLAGFGALETVSGTFVIVNNSALPDTDGLSSLERVEALTVYGNTKLETLTLPAATTVTSITLGSGSMPALESVSADTLATLTNLTVTQCGSSGKPLTLSFQELESITGTLSISYNPGLESLDGFPALDLVGTYYVTNNAALPTCEAVELRDRVDGVHAISAVNIGGNLADTCTP
jgi:hypothetical protein